MANDLMSSLASSFVSNNIEKIAGSIGLPKEVTSKAVKVALPAVMKQMSKNASTEDGAASLFAALKSNDGSALNDITALAKDPDAAKATGMLNHIFWDKQADIEKEIAASAGVDASQAQAMLKVVAPMIMAKLGQEESAGNLDMGSMVSLLGKSDKWSSLLTGFLDKDGDGDIKDDLLNMGMNKLKKKFFG